MLEDKIRSKLVNFKSDLLIKDERSIFHDYIAFGDCYAMDHVNYNDLRLKVVEHFRKIDPGVGPNDVTVVGSAKLGFSISPSKMFKIFNERSDIDVAITSTHLFDVLWQQVFDWSESGSLAYLQWLGSDRQQFNEYLFRGWIRPDKLPNKAVFEICRDWWDFFKQLPSLGSYGSNKISGGVYKTWNYLERYQVSSIKKCKERIELE